MYITLQNEGKKKQVHFAVNEYLFILFLNIYITLYFEISCLEKYLGLWTCLKISLQG